MHRFYIFVLIIVPMAVGLASAEHLGSRMPPKESITFEPNTPTVVRQGGDTFLDAMVIPDESR